MGSISARAVDDASRYFDRWLQFNQQHQRVPGVQAAILHGDRMVLSTAHGTADQSTGTTLTTEHLFRIASHSKTFTATAIMQLVERGSLRLDDTIGTWLSELGDSNLGARTIRELLSHAGGVVRDGADGDFWQLWRSFPDRAQLLSAAAALDAGVTEPNVSFKYSNIGYSLLGLIIETVSGRSYHDWVIDEIIQPLGLSDLGPELDPARPSDFAAGHSARSTADPSDAERRLVIEHIDTDAMAAATGFYSTAADLVRYFAAHFHGDDRLLSHASKRQMQHTAWTVEGTGGTGYGLGLAVNDIGGRRVLGHGGGYPGHITRSFFDPVDQLAVSVLTNSIDGPALPIATAAVRLVDLAGRASAQPGTSTEQLAAFEGRFANLWGVSDIVALGGRLHQITPTEPDPAASPTVLDVVDDDTLRISKTNGYGSAGEDMVFARNSDGTIESIRGGSGTTSFPIEAFRMAAAARSRVSLGDPIQP